MDTGLSGTGLVADDLYLLAHDDRKGKALLPPRPLGTGLALIAGEPGPLPVRAWLGFLGQTAVRDVAARLEQAGYLTRVRSGR